MKTHPFRALDPAAVEAIIYLEAERARKHALAKRFNRSPVVAREDRALWLLLQGLSPVALVELKHLMLLGRDGEAIPQLKRSMLKRIEDADLAYLFEKPLAEYLAAGLKRLELRAKEERTGMRCAPLRMPPRQPAMAAQAQAR